jgi:hypothetical protein
MHGVKHSKNQRMRDCHIHRSGISHPSNPKEGRWRKQLQRIDEILETKIIGLYQNISEIT